MAATPASRAYHESPVDGLQAEMDGGGSSTTASSDRQRATAADTSVLSSSAPLKNDNTAKSIRFFEYASVIPQLDVEQLQEDVDRAYGHLGRPHLTARTYSVPIPTSFTQLFSSPPSREYTYDPSFIPNAPPRLNLKLPSFSRKRRNTVSCQSHLKSCLKKRKTLLGANAIINPSIEGFEKASTSTLGTGNSKTGPARGRAHTLASSAPSSSSACVGSVNPVYCPALAKVVSESHASPSVQLSSSPSNTTSTSLSTTPPQGDSTQVAAGAHLPPTPTELLPIRDCCRACRKAASYGERCSDSEYFEKWSKAALEKRKRDEEILFERGEFVSRQKEHGEIVDEAEMSEPGRSIVQDAKVLEKEAKMHHGLHRSPVHSPGTSPAHSPMEGGQPRSPPPCAPPLLAHAHKQIVAHQEARAEKQAAHAAEVDQARQRIARLDVGKLHRHDDEEDDEEESDSDTQHSPREGDGLQLEGVGSPTSPSSMPASDNALQGKKTTLEEVEKNPICTLQGNLLLPCSSRALYTGAPSVTKPTSPRGTSATATTSSIEADRMSTSSSELSDDILSNLSSLGLSPASATTTASSWFGQEDLLHSPPEGTLEEGKGAYDYFPSMSTQQDSVHGTASLQSPAQMPNISEGSGCSPLMRSKACLRPMGMYAPAEDLMAQSCPTIKEEEGSISSTPSASAVPSAKAKQFPILHRSQTTTSALEKEAELRAALIEADKPVFTVPSRTQSLPANAGRRRIAGNSTFGEDDNGEGRKARPSWTTRFLHRGKGLASLGMAHGVVH